MTGNSTYGDKATLPGNALVVDEVLQEFQDRLQELGDSSPQQREKIYLANLQSCYTKRLVNPEAMRTRSEKEAAKAADTK